MSSKTYCDVCGVECLDASSLSVYSGSSLEVLRIKDVCLACEISFKKAIENWCVENGIEDIK